MGDTLPPPGGGMPWKECHVMDERLRFVARLLEGEKMAPLCAEFGISRKTGYKIFESTYIPTVPGMMTPELPCDQRCVLLQPRGHARASRRSVVVGAGNARQPSCCEGTGSRCGRSFRRVVRSANSRSSCQAPRSESSASGVVMTPNMRLTAVVYQRPPMVARRGRRGRYFACATCINWWKYFASPVENSPYQASNTFFSYMSSAANTARAKSTGAVDPAVITPRSVTALCSR